MFLFRPVRHSRFVSVQLMLDIRLFWTLTLTTFRFKPWSLKISLAPPHFTILLLHRCNLDFERAFDFGTAKNTEDSLCIRVWSDFFDVSSHYYWNCGTSRKRTKCPGMLWEYHHLTDAIHVRGLERDYVKLHASRVIYYYESSFKDNTAQGSRSTLHSLLCHTAATECLFSSAQLCDFLSFTLQPVNTITFKVSKNGTSVRLSSVCMCLTVSNSFS